MQKMWPFFLVLPLLFLCVTESSARRTYFTPEQKAQLEKAQTVFLNVLALTEKGRADAGPLLEVVKRRLEEVEYTVVTKRSQPYDIEFKVKCEERKRWTGTTRSGGDAELADAPARLWKGPACLFSYKLQEKDLGWYKEVRTDFNDAWKAAKAANVKDAGAYALDQLKTKLEEYDFPVTVTAEWDQTGRLLKVLNDPETSKQRKLKVLSVLNDLEPKQALPHLKEIIKDKEVGHTAIVKLAAIGSDSIPLLSDLLQTSQQPKVRIAAAKGLGEVAAATGNPQATLPLIDYLQRALSRMESSADIDFPLLTEVVWAIGKQRNEKSIQPMAELTDKIWLIYDTSSDMAKLREAANWTYKMVDLDGQIQ